MGLLPTLGKGGKPVLNLEFLLDDVVRNTVPLDWCVQHRAFRGVVLVHRLDWSGPSPSPTQPDHRRTHRITPNQNQHHPPTHPRDSFWRHNAVQPLNIVASGLHSMQALALRSGDGHFDSFEGLLTCLKSSMCVPGVAGPPVRLNVTCSQTLQEREEVLADALIFEPIPFRSAVEDGCTHVVTLRTRPDGAEVLGHKVGQWVRGSVSMSVSQWKGGGGGFNRGWVTDRQSGWTGGVSGWGLGPGMVMTEH